MKLDQILLTRNTPDQVECIRKALSELEPNIEEQIVKGVVSGKTILVIWNNKIDIRDRKLEQKLLETHDEDQVAYLCHMIEKLPFSEDLVEELINGTIIAEFNGIFVEFKSV